MTTCSTRGSLQRQHRRGRKGVVSFKFHHGPHNDAGRGENFFKDGKLRKQVGFDPFTGLVTCPEIISKRLDHMVGGYTNVGDAAAHHGQ